MRKFTLILCFIPLLSLAQDDYLWQTKENIRKQEKRIYSTQDKFVDSIHFEILGRVIEGALHYEYDNSGCVLRCSKYFITRRLIGERDELINLLKDTANVGLQISLNTLNLHWIPKGSEVMWVMCYLVDYVEINGKLVGFTLTRALYKYNEQWFIVEQGNII